MAGEAGLRSLAPGWKPIRTNLNARLRPNAAIAAAEGSQGCERFLRAPLATVFWPLSRHTQQGFPGGRQRKLVRMGFQSGEHEHPRVCSPLSAGYAETLGAIKRLIQQERLRVVLAANAAIVQLYWDIGRMILDRQEHAGWGAKVIDRLSADLRDANPEMQGLSPPPGRAGELCNGSLHNLKSQSVTSNDRLVVQGHNLWRMSDDAVGDVNGRNMRENVAALRLGSMSRRRS